MYIFTYTFFHWYRFFFLFWFSLAIHDFLFWAVDCWGLPPWSPLFPLYYFFVPLALEFSAVDRLLWIALDFSAVDFPFLSSSFFIRFFSPLSLSSSVFLSAAETFLFLLESSRLRQQILFTALTYSIAAHGKSSGCLSEVKVFHHSRPRRSCNKICLIYLICFHSHPRRS